MKRTRLHIVGAALIALVAGVFAFQIASEPQQPVPATQPITDFASCVAAGLPVLESYPRQCRAPDGTLYVDDVEEQPQSEPTTDERIRVEAPRSGETVTSPLVVHGEARGPWYFEASFPVRLEDASGNILARVPAQAQGEWMTEDFVPFEVVLTFTNPATETGTLILERDNPSDLPENAAEVRIPVRFGARTAE